MSIRERDDVAALNVSFPYGPLPVDFQVTGRFINFDKLIFYAAINCLTVLEAIASKLLRECQLYGRASWQTDRHIASKTADR